MDLGGMEKGLNELFTGLCHDKVKISDLEDITVGWETRIIAFTLTRPKETSELVVRLYGGVGAAAKAQWEFHVMSRLSAEGYPVPKVYTCSVESEALGSPFLIMERIEGSTLWDVFFTSPREKWSDVLAINARLMTRLHDVDPTKIFPSRLGYATRQRVLECIDGEAKSLDMNGLLREFAPIMQWLESASPALVESPLCVIHRDLHPRNILLQRDGSHVVIDWGGSRLGDFREDLCWTGLLTATFTDDSLKDAFYRAYMKFSHRTVENIDYFEAFSALRRLADASISLKAGPEARGMRPEATEQVRQNRLHYSRVYGRLVEVTGIRLPRVEELFSCG